MLKYKVFYFICLYSLFLLPLQAQEETANTGITFFKGTFQQAMDEAKKQNKPLFVDFYAVWCGPCKRMAKLVFTQDSVGQYFNEKFINLQLDAEKTENVAIAKQYKVDAFPTLAFIGNDGKALSINVGAMSARDFLEAAKIATGEAIGFKELYEIHQKDPDNLELQQSLLMQASRFLSAQEEGMDAERWVVRIKKLYRSYIEKKMGPALINRQDYIIISGIGMDTEESKLKMVNFINSNLPAWKKEVGDAAAYYVVEYNDEKIEKLAKEGNQKYKEYLEKIKGEYKDAYSVISYVGDFTPYDASSKYADAIYSIYKNTDIAGYISRMNDYFKALGENITPGDYGKAAQNLYYAAGKKLTVDEHKTAISWVEKALASETGVMDRVNYLVMIGDSYRDMKEYDSAKKYYNQGYMESLRMTNMEMAQQMVQQMIAQKLAVLDMLKK